MKVRVASHGISNPIWENFVDFCFSDGCVPDETSRSIGEKISTELAKYGARNLYMTDFIEFENEADVTFFLLRWS